MNTGAAGKILQHSHSVIADRRHAEAAPREFRLLVLQLDELAFAERSPVRRAHEHQHQSLRPAQGGERLLLPVLIGAFEIRNARTDLRTGLQRYRRQHDEQALHPAFTRWKVAYT